MLVVQSCPSAVPSWVARCLDSVAAWAAAGGLAYERLGDELFAFLPAALSQRGLPRLARTDAARLGLMQARLAEGHDAVLWLDADVAVFEGPRVSLPGPDVPFAACREVWITGAGEGGLKAVPYVCNAALFARSASALAPLATAVCERALDGRVVQDHSLGPDLLTSMNRRSPVPVVSGVGLFSPHVVRDVAAGGGQALDLLAASSPEPIGAANLCASSAVGVTEAEFDAAVDRLLGGEVGPW